MLTLTLVDYIIVHIFVIKNNSEISSDNSVWYNVYVWNLFWKQINLIEIIVIIIIV